MWYVKRIINTEHRIVTPLIMIAYGSMGTESQISYDNRETIRENFVKNSGNLDISWISKKLFFPSKANMYFLKNQSHFERSKMLKSILKDATTGEKRSSMDNKINQIEQSF